MQLTVSVSQESTSSNLVESLKMLRANLPKQSAPLSDMDKCYGTI